VSAMPPGALLPRDWLIERLSDRPSATVGQTDGGALVDLTVADLARLFSKRPSTVRGWVERGHFPGAYKLHGKEWRVPQSAVTAFRDRQRSGADGAPTSRSRLSHWRTIKPPHGDRRTQTGQGAAVKRPLPGTAED